MKRMASFLTSARLIEDVLHMPKNHVIVGAEWDFATDSVRFYVQGQDLPEVAQGAVVPDVTPVITREDDPETRLPIYEWNWGLPKK